MWMINLGNIEVCEELCRICNLYKEYIDIKLIYGSKLIDGASLMSVLTLCLNKEVIIDIKCYDDSVLDDFYDNIITIGAYKVNN